MPLFFLYPEETFTLPLTRSHLLKEKQDLLWSLEGQDGEDGSAVHAPHAGTVAHIAEQDGCYLWAQLKQESRTIYIYCRLKCIQSGKRGNFTYFPKVLIDSSGCLNAVYAIMQLIFYLGNTLIDGFTISVFYGHVL